MILHVWSCHQVMGAWFRLDLMQQVATDGNGKHLSHRGLKSPTANGDSSDASSHSSLVRSSGETYSPQDVDHSNPRERAGGVKTLRNEGGRLLALQSEELKVGTTLRPEAHETRGVALKPLLIAGRNLTRQTQEPSVTAQSFGSGGVSRQGWFGDLVE